MFERADEWRQVILLTGGVEPAFGGAFAALFRHDADTHAAWS